jgi:ABC-type transporter Mla MlaB component
LPLTRDYEEAARVLKITRLARHGRVQTIKLEGEILEAWVGAVRDACTTPDCRAGHLRLDMATVNYVDAAGMRLLHDLMRQGIEITACSSFVAELLHLGHSGKPGASGVHTDPP